MRNGQIKDLSNLRFGHLVVESKNFERKNGKIYWWCQCDCGNRKLIMASCLKSKKTISCGCSKKNRFKTHGFAKTRLYKIWMDMKTRCNNANTPYYHRYGGRGISYISDWDAFETFRNWAIKNGYQDNLTLDRIDVDGDYTPQNCRWITNQEQQLNKRTTRYLTFNGKTQSVTEWAHDIGMKPKTLNCRINDYHWPVEKAILTPVKERKHENKNQKTVG